MNVIDLTGDAPPQMPPGLQLFPGIVDDALSDAIISRIERELQFPSGLPMGVKKGKTFYQMLLDRFPEEWVVLQGLIASLTGVCDLDFAIQIKYDSGSLFPHHYDSKAKWGPSIVGVSLKTEVQLYFTKKGCETINVTVPPGSIYVMSGDSRYLWRHGIKKVKDTRYSITFRKMILYQ
jgi:hypothetical protein